MTFEDVLTFLGLMLLGAFLVVLIGFLTAFPVMWLWNWLIPHLFSGPVITLYEALGLSMLCSLLFKNSTPTTSKK